MDEYRHLHDEELASIPILLKLKRLEVGATSNNTKTMILDVMAMYKGLSNNDMASQWICLGCDGVLRHSS
jgi:hypothetical protein